MTVTLPKPAIAGTALIVCKDVPTRHLILESLQPLAIDPEICEDWLVAINLLDKRKFEAVIVDLLLGEGALAVLARLRFSRANHTAVSFAITTGAGAQISDSPDAVFVLQRPLLPASVDQNLRAAFALIVRERRRYFRCPIEVPAFVRAQGHENLLCQTVNISEGGIALNVPAALDLDSTAFVRVSLPDRPNEFFAKTRVVWCGPGGFVGLEFRSLTSQQKSELQEWLARKLDETLPENVASLFPGVGQSSIKGQTVDPRPQQIGRGD